VTTPYTVAAALAEAERTAAIVTLHVDGHAPDLGTVTAHPTLPHGFYQLRPVGNGRALTFAATDVTEVIFE
jgi:hypothetical protein